MQYNSSMRSLTLLLALSLLLAGCSSIPGLQGKPTYQSSLPLVQKPPPTYEAVLPIVSGQGGQPDSSWQIFPQLLDASLPGIDFTIKITTPVISGEAAVQHAAFTQAVQAQVDDWMKSYSIEQVGTPESDMGWFVTVDYQVTSAPDWVPAIPFAISSKAPTQQTPAQVLFSAGHDLLSILFEDFAYLGGAHPGTYYVALNYDTTAAKVLTLADLFEPGADYLGLVSSLCIAELQTRSDMMFPDFATSGAAALQENYQVWAVTPQGLLVVFQEYQVAPYAAGAQSVLLPYDALAGLLDPAGPLGSFAK